MTWLDLGREILDEFCSFSGYREQHFFRGCHLTRKTKKRTPAQLKQKRDAARAKYANDPEHRAKTLARTSGNCRDRYARDEAYRERKRALRRIVRVGSV